MSGAAEDGPRPLTDEEQRIIWSIEHHVVAALRADQRSKARYHLRELRWRVAALEEAVLGRRGAANDPSRRAGQEGA